MKLLMITGDTGVASGKKSAFYDTLLGLAPHCERIDVLCPRVRIPHVVRSLGANIFLHPSRYGRLLRPFAIRTDGCSLLRTYHHDVCTVHEYPPFLHGIGARLLARVCALPMLLEIHHIVGWPRAAAWHERVGRWMMRWIFPWHARRFAAVRVVNDDVRRTLVAWGVPASRIIVVPSVYLDARAIALAARGAEKRFDCVFCGRLVANKNPFPVLEAIARAPGQRLLVIGDGPLRSSLEARARALAISDRVTFVGWLPSSDAVLAAIASGSVFIMNSLSEGNPRVLVEAMAIGLPVIATRVGIAPSLVREGENGYFTDGSAADIAAKLLRLAALRDADRRSLCEAAKAAVTPFLHGEGIAAYVRTIETLARGD